MLATVGLSAQTEMTLEEKVAKMLIIGVQGQELTADNKVIEMVRDKKVSGVIFFEHNITSVAKKKDSKAILQKFIADIQAVTTQKLFFAVDQEGGRVNRLKSKYGFADMVSHKEVGAKDDLNYTKQVADIIAGEVKSAGFNINFAPCVDVDINPLCPVIGKVDRSFSPDVAKVTDHARIYIDSHKEQNIITSLKHFPGHGSSVVDSHLGFTDITKTWSAKELQPFKDLIDEGRCDIVMVGHLYNSDIDKRYPASLSKPTIDSLLRTNLGYKGVVMTDDMQMKAITDNYGFEEALVLAVNAGVDMFIISSNTSKGGYNAYKAIDIIVDYVNRGVIKESRINESLARIEELRKKL